MGIYNEDTKKLMSRDTEEFQRKQNELRDRLASALDGYTDSMCFAALESAIHYGWRMPDGRWHLAPSRHGYDIISIKEETEENSSTESLGN